MIKINSSIYCAFNTKFDNKVPTLFVQRHFREQNVFMDSNINALSWTIHYLLYQVHLMLTKL